MQNQQHRQTTHEGRKETVTEKIPTTEKQTGNRPQTTNTLHIQGDKKRIQIQNPF